MSTTRGEERQGRVYRLRESNIDWLDVEGDVVALDSQQSVYLSTNESGAELWRSLVDGATQDELAEQLVTAYGIDREQALNDVEKFLAMVTDQKLLADEDG